MYCNLCCSPKSWRDPNGTIIQQRSKQQAIDILKKHRDNILNKNITFAELASKESDCSSAKNGGDLGMYITSHYSISII